MFSLGLSFRRKAPISSAPQQNAAVSGKHSDKIQTDDTEEMPSEEVINEELKSYMDLMGVSADMQEETLHGTVQEKWDTLKFQRSTDSSRTGHHSLDASKSPEEYVREMTENHEMLSNVYLTALKAELLSCSSSWLERFYEAGAMDAFACVMLHFIGSDKLTHLQTAVDALTAALKSIDDLHRVASTPDLVVALASCLTLSATEDNKTIFSVRISAIKLLTAITSSPNYDHQLVIEAAFERLRATADESARYESLCNIVAEDVSGSAFQAEAWTLKGLVVMFVNEYLNDFDLEDRIELRQELQLAGWQDALEFSQWFAKGMETNEEVASNHELEAALARFSSNLDAHFALMMQDEAEVSAQSGSAALSDPEETFGMILSNAAKNGHTPSLIAILRYLLVIPSHLAIGAAMWERCEKAMRTVVMGTEAERESLKFSDIGVIVELQQNIQEQEERIKKLQQELQAYIRGMNARPKLMPSPPLMPRAPKATQEHPAPTSAPAPDAVDSTTTTKDRAQSTGSESVSDRPKDRALSTSSEAGADVPKEITSQQVSAAFDEEIAALKQQLEAALSSKGSLTSAMAAAEETCAAAQQRAQQAEESNNAMRTQLAALQQQLDSARAEIAAITEQLKANEQKPTAIVESAAALQASAPGGGDPSPIVSQAGPMPARPGAPGVTGPRPGPGGAPARPGPVASGPGSPGGPRPGPGPAGARLGPMPVSGTPSAGPRPGRPSPGEQTVAPAPASAGPAAARPGRPGPGGPAAAGPSAARPGRPAGPVVGTTAAAAPNPLANLKQAPAAVPSRAKKARPVVTAKLKPFFWTKIMDASIEHTLFKNLSDERVQIDNALLEKMFAVTETNVGGTVSKPQASTTSVPEKRKGPVLILDSKRQQNAGIGLARIRMKPAEIREAVLAADTSVLTAEKLSILLSIIPTADEIQQINDFEGDRSQLGSLEQFFLTISDVPRYEQRLVSMLFRLRADVMVSETRARVETIRDAVECIRNSNSLRGLLEYVLAVGNYLNSESNARGGAYGYRLDTLKKLSTIKGSDNKTTLLDFVARAAFEEAKVRGLARLPQDLAPVSAAKPESLEAVMAEVKAIERGVNQVTTQLDMSLKSTKVEGDLFEAVMQPFVTSAKASVGKLVEDANETQTSFKDLVNSFAEEASDSGPFFQIFHDFRMDFKRVLDKEQERRNPKSLEPAKANPTPSKSNPGTLTPISAASSATKAPTTTPATSTASIRPMSTKSNVVDSILGEMQSGSGNSIVSDLQRRRDVKRASIAIPMQPQGLQQQGIALPGLVPRPPSYAKKNKGSEGGEHSVAASLAAASARRASIKAGSAGAKRRSLAMIHNMQVARQGVNSMKLLAALPEAEQ